MKGGFRTEIDRTVFFKLVLLGLYKYGAIIEGTSNDHKWIYISLPETTGMTDWRGNEISGEDILSMVKSALHYALPDELTRRIFFVVRKGERFTKEMSLFRIRTVGAELFLSMFDGG